MSTDQLVVTRESDPSSSVQFQHAVSWNRPTKALSQPPLVVIIIFGISEAIPEMVPDDHQAPFLRPSGTSFGIVRHRFWDCQAPVLGSSGNSFGISGLLLGYKKEPKRCNKECSRVFKGVLELPYVNICYISSHGNHVNHPFKDF